MKNRKWRNKKGRRVIETNNDKTAKEKKKEKEIRNEKG